MHSKERSRHTEFGSLGRKTQKIGAGEGEDNVKRTGQEKKELLLVAQPSKGLKNRQTKKQR